MSETRRRSSARSAGKSISRNISGTRSEGEMSHVSDAAMSERRRSSSRTGRRLSKPASPEKASKTSGGEAKQSRRMRQIMERLDVLARPTSRRLRSLWDDNCGRLPPDRRDKIKSALEEDYFLSPEQTEEYFQMVSKFQKPWPGGHAAESRKEQVDRQKELRQRQKWLVNFSAQVAYRMCDYIAKGGKEILVSNRLRSIADVVLERVAEILGEQKPTRTHPGRLPRFMVAISDRIAVWIENAVYRAEAAEAEDECGPDQHMHLDRQWYSSSYASLWPPPLRRSCGVGSPAPALSDLGPWWQGRRSSTVGQASPVSASAAASSHPESSTPGSSKYPPLPEHPPPHPPRSNGSYVLVTRSVFRPSVNTFSIRNKKITRNFCVFFKALLTLSQAELLYIFLLVFDSVAKQ